MEVAESLVVKDGPPKKKSLIRRSYVKRARGTGAQNYKPEDVVAAMHAIWRGMSRRKAAKVFNIPRSTLLDKLDGKRPVDASPGPNPFLTKKEERTLETWAVDMYRRGFPLKTEDLKDMAQAVVQSSQRRTSFKDGRPGRSWMRNFLLRHPRVYAMGADKARAGATSRGGRGARSVTTRQELRQWCQRHRNFMATVGHQDILDDPQGHRVFNVDHSEFVFDSESGNLIDLGVCGSGSERAVAADRAEGNDRSSGDCTTVVAAFSAAGRVAPLMLVYPQKDLSDSVENLPSDWVTTHSTNGTLNGQAFLDYLVAFRRWLERESVQLPVLLLIDGRRSRLNMDVTKFCQEQGIIVYSLFPTPRPAVAELFGAAFHETPSLHITKSNLAMRLREALNTHAIPSENGGSIFDTYGILPHLQTMMRTLAEVKAQPELTEEIMIHDEKFSDCEYDLELTPVEGEIEVEFPGTFPDARTLAAFHPARRPEWLLEAGGAPDYLVMKDTDALPYTVPSASSAAETERNIADVESEISRVLSNIISMEKSVKGEKDLELDAYTLSPPPSPQGEPFLGFPRSAGAKDAQACVRFLEQFLSLRGVLEDFRAAYNQNERQWTGDVRFAELYDGWVAALEQSAT